MGQTSAEICITLSFQQAQFQGKIQTGHINILQQRSSFTLSPGRSSPNVGAPFPLGNVQLSLLSHGGGEYKKRPPLSLPDCCGDKRVVYKSFLQQHEQTQVKASKARCEPKWISCLCPQKGRNVLLIMHVLSDRQAPALYHPQVMQIFTCKTLLPKAVQMRSLHMRLKTQTLFKRNKSILKETPTFSIHL